MRVASLSSTFRMHLFGGGCCCVYAFCAYINFFLHSTCLCVLHDHRQEQRKPEILVVIIGFRPIIPTGRRPSHSGMVKHRQFILQAKNMPMNAFTSTQLCQRLQQSVKNHSTNATDRNVQIMRNNISTLLIFKGLPPASSPRSPTISPTSPGFKSV